MVVHALRGAGADPSYLVGGEVRSTGANAGWGTGEWLVVEADESDRILLKLAPTIAVVTNAELDHHTTYASRRDVDEHVPQPSSRRPPSRSCRRTSSRLAARARRSSTPSRS